MNYLKNYNILIERAKNRNIDDSIYTENHHIIPKSIFNDEIVEQIFKNCVNNVDDVENIVKLLPEEHYIAHLFLVKIFYGNKNCYEKMLYAANFMSNRTQNNKKYGWLKREFSNMMSEKLLGKKSRAKGKKWTTEQKSNKSKNHYMLNKTYEECYGKKKSDELKLLRKLNRLGKVNSPEVREKLSKRIIDDKWRKKISKANSGKKRSASTIQKIKKYLDNPDINVHVKQTLYKFYHIDGREIISRQYEMKYNFGCKKIHKLIRGTQKYCNGWFYKGEIV